MSYKTVREHHAKVVNELLDHLTSAEKLRTKGCEQLLEACSLLVSESRQAMPLQYLKHCARVTDWGRLRLTAGEIATRKGPYPYYGRGNEIARIDDYSFTEKSMLVGCRGAVSTFEGKFFILIAQGKYSVSELFHIVLPAESDFEYIRLVLEARDAARYVKGPKEAPAIDLGDLCNVLLPWPRKEIRDAYVFACKFCEETNLHEIESLIGALWNANARLVENIQTPSAEACFEDDHLTSMPGLEDAPNLDGSGEGADRGALAVAERLLGIIAPSESAELYDVVASTNDLASQGVSMSYDCLICFPPPNQGEWTQSRVDERDPRWVLGTPPRNKANFAWIQQAIACMSENATALLLLCNAPLHSEIGREHANRIALARCGLLEAVISLPGGIFDDDRPPSSFLVLRKNRPAGAPILLIDASKEGALIKLNDKGLATRVLPANSINLIADTYRKWVEGDGYHDIEGFCAETSYGEIAECGYLLSPWAYV